MNPHPPPRASSRRRRAIGALRGLPRLAALSIAVATATPVSAQLSMSSDPLADFGATMVGSWEADGSRHVFEWGVGGRVLKSTSYASDGDGWVVTSEGWWYWDPVAEAVRGTTVAIGMGIDLFEHTVRMMKADEIVHDLVAYGPMGGTYVERWTFEPDGYPCALEQDGSRLMGGRYQRVR